MFTKGPWDTFAQCVFTDSTGYLCAIVSEDQETAYDNACLISAAPDLLKVCIDGVANGFDADAAKAAIAKALHETK